MRYRLSYRASSIPQLAKRSHGTTTRVPNAFTTSSLNEIRRLLQPAPDHTFTFPPHTVQFAKRPASEAAVLLPLMSIKGSPHILMELRSSGLRTHAGEISFPGGKVDKTDRSLVQAALREAHEELELPPENVEILGMLNSPEYSLGNKARVWPIVGFVHSSPPPWSSGPSTLASLALSTLRPSPDEVAEIIPFPLSALHDMARQRLHHFRIDSRKPYWKYQAGDLVYRPDQSEALAAKDAQPELEVWGLSGWLLNRLAWTAGWMDAPSPEEHED